MARKRVQVYAGHPRAGRRFEPAGERELSADALNAAKGLPNAHRGVRVLLETAGPFGIPDLVAVVGPKDVLTRRLRLNVPPLLNQVDAGVVAAAAERAARSTEALATRVGWPIETVSRRIPGLVRSGALREVRPDAFVRPPALRPVGRLYAIEAKVKDWRRALRQARTYNVWCDSYVIVMPPLGPVSTPNLIDAVSNDGGGLMLGGSWVTKPKLRPKTLPQRLWGSEHAIAAFFA
jgi:hypothetical protein